MAVEASHSGRAHQEFLRAVGEGGLAGRASLVYRGPAEMLKMDVGSSSITAINS